MLFRISILLFVSYITSIQGRKSGSKFGRPKNFRFSGRWLRTGDSGRRIWTASRIRIDNFYLGFGYGGFNQMILNAFKEEHKSNGGHQSTFMNNDDFLNRPSRSPVYRFVIWPKSPPNYFIQKWHFFIFFYSSHKIKIHIEFFVV